MPKEEKQDDEKNQDDLDKKLANMGLEEYSERLRKIDNGNMQGY